MSFYQILSMVTRPALSVPFWLTDHDHVHASRSSVIA